MLEDSRSPKVRSYRDTQLAVVAEIARVLESVVEAESQAFALSIAKSERVFILAVGRVFLSLQCLGKRLAHLGLDIQVVGSLTEKPIRVGDTLLVASGSGESIIPVQIALKAKELGANIALITAASASTLKSIADITLHLSAPTKKSTNEGAKSIQPMSTLFDQSLHIAGDIIALLIADIINCKTDTLWQYHANLE